jgi:hypothetical protein
MARPRRKDADWFHHRFKDGSIEDEIVHLVQLYGGDGYMFYFRTLEHLTNKPGYKLKVTRVSKTALIRHTMLSSEKFDEIFQTALDVNLLQLKDDVLKSDWLIKDLKPLEQKRKRDAEYYQHIRKPKKQTVTGDDPLASDTIPPVFDAETKVPGTETHIVEERRGEKSIVEKESRGEKSDGDDLPLPALARINTVAETLLVFGDVCKVFGQDELTMTDERRKNLDAVLREHKPDFIVTAVENFVASSAFQDTKHFDWLFDHFKWPERIDFWAKGGPPKNGVQTAGEVEALRQLRATA